MPLVDAHFHTESVLIIWYIYIIKYTTCNDDKKYTYHSLIIYMVWMSNSNFPSSWQHKDTTIITFLISPRLNFTLTLESRPAKSCSQNSNTKKNVERLDMCGVAENQWNKIYYLTAASYTLNIKNTYYKVHIKIQTYADIDRAKHL